MNIDRLYDIRNLGVTIMRTAVVSIGLAALATLYLGSVSSASATYGGAIALLVPVITVVAALIVYVPADRQLRAATGIKTAPIFQHQFLEDLLETKGERELLDRLEKDLDF